MASYSPAGATPRLADFSIAQRLVEQYVPGQMQPAYRPIGCPRIALHKINGVRSIWFRASPDGVQDHVTKKQLTPRNIARGLFAFPFREYALYQLSYFHPKMKGGTRTHGLGRQVTCKQTSARELKVAYRVRFSLVDDSSVPPFKESHQPLSQNRLRTPLYDQPQILKKRCGRCRGQSAPSLCQTPSVSLTLHPGRCSFKIRILQRQLSEQTARVSAPVDADPS